MVLASDFAPVDNLAWPVVEFVPNETPKVSFMRQSIALALALGQAIIRGRQVTLVNLGRCHSRRFTGKIVTGKIYVWKALNERQELKLPTAFNFPPTADVHVFRGF